MKLIFIDVETTGLEYPDSGLIQLSGVIEIEGEIKASFDHRIRPFPADVVSDEALSVNGLTHEEIAGYEDPRVVFDRFISLLGQFVDRYDRSDKFHLVAYNAPFDSEHIRAWFEKNKNRFYGSWFWHPPIDVMGMAAVAAMASRSRLNNFKLTTVARALGLHVEESLAHDALYDIRLTRSVFQVLVRQKNQTSSSYWLHQDR